MKVLFIGGELDGQVQVLNDWAGRLPLRHTHYIKNLDFTLRNTDEYVLNEHQGFIGNLPYTLPVYYLDELCQEGREACLAYMAENQVHILIQACVERAYNNPHWGSHNPSSKLPDWAKNFFYTGETPQFTFTPPDPPDKPSQPKTSPDKFRNFAEQCGKLSLPLGVFHTKAVE